MQNWIQLKKNYTRSSFKIQTLTILLIGLFAFGVIPQTTLASQMIPSKSSISGTFTSVPQDGIQIYYNPYNTKMHEVALATYELLTCRLTNVQLISIDSFFELKQKLDSNPEIAIYALDANLIGPIIGLGQISWNLFYELLQKHSETHHIVGMPNTLSLQKAIDDHQQSLGIIEVDNSLSSDHIYHSEAEQIDFSLLVLYNLWTVGEIYRQASEIDPDLEPIAQDLLAIGLQVYSDNFNYFFRAQIDPQPATMVGVANPLSAEERKAQMWARHVPTQRPAAFLKQSDGSLEEIPLDQLPEDFSPKIRVVSQSELASTRDVGDFILGELPFLSGLQGPIGDIVDILLKLLGEDEPAILSIPGEIMSSLQNIFEELEPIIGLVKDFDLESPLKSILEVLSNEFPFIEEFKPYLEVFMKALFNFRGSLDDIIELVGEIINALMESVLPPSVNSFIGEILDVGGSLGTILTDVVSGGKSSFDAIAGYFMENVVDKLLNKTLVAALNCVPAEVTSVISRMSQMVETIINYAMSFDIEAFIEDMASRVIQSVLGSLSSTMQQGIDQIVSLVKMGMEMIDLVDQFNIESAIDLVKNVVSEIIGESNIIGNIDDFVQQIMDVVKTVKETVSTDISAFREDIEAILTEKLNSAIPTPIRTITTDIMTLVAGIYNEGFSVDALPDIFGISEALLDQLGLPSIDLNNIKAAINGTFQPILGILSFATDSDQLKQLMHQTLVDLFPDIPDITDLSDLQNIDTISRLLSSAIDYFDLGGVFTGIGNFTEVMDQFGEITAGVFQIVDSVRGQSFQGIMQGIWIGVTSIVGVHPSFDDVPLDMVLQLMQQCFPDAFGLDLEDLPRPMDLIENLVNLAAPYLTGLIDSNTLQTFLETAMDLKDLFTRGLDWIVGKVLDWLMGLLNPVLEELETAIGSLFGDDNELLGFHDTLGIGLGEWSLFDLQIDLGITANFNFDPTPLFDLIRSLILDGRNTLSLNSVDDFFQIIFSFFEISPQFYAELGVSGLDSSKNSFMQFLLEALGLELSFTGSARFVLNLFTFRGGVFEWDNFLKVVEWGFTIRIQISRTFTLLDFLTGGVGGGVLNSLMEFLGLDGITVTIWIAVEIDIVKRAATAIAPEESTLTLVINLGAALHIGINLYIVEIAFDGSLEIILTFFQDFASSAPMKITLRLVLTLRIHLAFLFISLDETWTWEPGGPWDLSPNPTDEEYQSSGIGFDNDKDGLGNDYEAGVPGLNPDSADSDGDGATDKLEVQTMGTDASIPDTDGDGLTDGEEWDLGTNPIRPDTDWDGLTDYAEHVIYETDPFSQDSDGDGLSDEYEIFTPLDMSNVTSTVAQVIIGGVTYTDRTDPLNQDTDGDGLVDGDEGPMGAYYGLAALYNETASDPTPVIFNYGYTHPLDADTDDDSFLQLYNGMIDTQALMFLKDMNDGAEVKGFDIIMYDSEGEPELKHVYTNPVNPDTDGDTGVTDRTPQPGMWLNSDGYELAQTPPTDPTDGDSDDDGLIDGIEGVLNPYSNHTNPNDPDTDDDSLYDMQEMLLGSDPRSQDSDGDMISDGDEFYVFYTNPNIADSDFDGVEDGEETYLWHSNPLIDDSDGDGLTDGQEILLYGSDPMDEDSDNDGLTDYQEIRVYYTDPFDGDSDKDGLLDGEEIRYYNTDPLNWDTDRDSIIEPNALGKMTWPMSDYDEIMTYNTNATKADTDSDGLSDGIELYLAAGIIPWCPAYPLNPRINDTDGDGFKDGSELQLKNVTDIIYPYRAITFVFPFNSDPTKWDTDFDNVSDYEEVVSYNSHANNTDTDNDTLTDWEEIRVYGTSPIYNDTDGDGLTDVEELSGPISAGVPNKISEIDDLKPIQENSESIPRSRSSHRQMTGYGTDPLDPDTDDDWLPDGSEVFFYHSDPLDEDSDGDHINDTYEFDTDFDGLSDGLEFHIGLQVIPAGGFLNPDSDGDGIVDGEEFYLYKTNPGLADSDGDGFSDGTEISVGTDPLSYTSVETFETTLAVARGVATMDILLPRDGGRKNYENTPIRVVNYTTFQEMWFRYMEQSDNVWSGNYSMVYQPNVQQWYDGSQIWVPGQYRLQVMARDYDGAVSMLEITFDVVSGKEPPPWWVWVIVGGVVIVTGVGLGIGLRLRKKHNKSKSLAENQGTPPKPESPEKSKEVKAGASSPPAKSGGSPAPPSSSGDKQKPSPGSNSQEKLKGNKDGVTTPPKKSGGSSLSSASPVSTKPQKGVK